MAYSSMQITKAKTFADIEDFIQRTSNKYSVKKIILGHEQDFMNIVKRMVEPRLKKRGQVYAALFTIKVLPSGLYFKDKQMILNWCDKHKIFFQNYFKGNLVYMDLKFTPKEDNAMIKAIIIPICDNDKLSFGGMLNGYKMKEFKEAYNNMVTSELKFEVIEELGKIALKKQIEEIKKERDVLKNAITMFTEEHTRIGLSDTKELFKAYEYRAQKLA